MMDCGDNSATGDKVWTWESDGGGGGSPPFFFLKRKVVFFLRRCARY
jgi:hypothetical protein